MTAELTSFQKSLIRQIQLLLPISQRPFRDLALSLDSDESNVLKEIQQFKKIGLIRRFGVSIDCRPLGRMASLVCAHVPEEDLLTTSLVINSLPGVSHNYLRDHHYNLWFTLQGKSTDHIQSVLENLSKRLGCPFNQLPATKYFKLDVRFNPDISNVFAKDENYHRPSPHSCTDFVVLTDNQKRILKALQTGLKMTPRPFDFLTDNDNDISRVLDSLKYMTEKGVIRKISAVIDQRKLGIEANVMFVAEVAAETVESVGIALASYAMVTHCYERQTFPGFPYNLFAMMHAGSMPQITELVKKVADEENIKDYALLTTTAELKKKPVKHTFEP